MKTLNEAVTDFLAQRRIAVVGVSRDAKQPANFIFNKLRAAGHEVFPVNPAAATVEGIVRECAGLGIRRVWLHRSFGAGSASAAAEQAAREAGITLIPAGCPAMFCEPVDVAHRCFRWCLKLTGGLPATVEN